MQQVTHGINLRFLNTVCRSRMSDFLADCAERIIVLGIVHRRIINRFHKFILWLGIPLHRVQDTKPNEFCRIVSEFALEYRTTRERVIQQLEKKANHRERNKTRGKMITEVSYKRCLGSWCSYFSWTGGRGGDGGRWKSFRRAGPTFLSHQIQLSERERHYGALRRGE